jgi:hypothetical protein
VGKGDDKLVGLDAVRVGEWFKAVMATSGAPSVPKLNAVLALKGVDCTVDRWKGYSALRRLPDVAFTREIDQVLPGTAAVFKDGPAGLPLWDLLDVYTPATERNGKVVPAKTEIPKLLCNRIFSGLPRYQSGLSLQDKWGRVFESLLAHYGPHWTGAHTNLENLVQDPSRNDIRLSNALSNIDARLMVVIMAVALLSLDSSDKEMWDYAQYFMDGILGMPLENRFGKQISDFVSKLFVQIG